MLRALSSEIRECYRHAEECKRRAESSVEPTRTDFLEMERRWLFLAHSYEFTERLTDFSRPARRPAHK